MKFVVFSFQCMVNIKTILYKLQTLYYKTNYKLCTTNSVLQTVQKKGPCMMAETFMRQSPFSVELIYP